MHRILKFFDKFEDSIREHLSRVPIVYAFVGGAAVVIFWRGIWHFADELQSMGGWWDTLFSPDISLIMSIAVLLGTGLFVSFFIGDRIIMSGLKHEKKVEEKTEAEVREEETMLAAVHQKLDVLGKEISEIKSLIVK